jgi:zinc protease
MKRLLTLLMVVVVLFPTAPADAVDPRTLTFPPLSFKVPTAERVTLDNGMVVYLLQDRELPLVTVQAYIGTGSVHEPADKTGLAALTGAVMRSGGTTRTAPDLLDNELEFMASSLETAIGADVGTASLSCLEKNLHRTLELFAQVLATPAFRQDRVDLAKNRAIDAIRRQNDDPKDSADRELRRAIYQGHPLGRFPTVATVNAIDRDDLVAFHRRFFYPNNIILAVSGDFQREALLNKLEQTFAGWQRHPVELPTVATPTGAEQPAIVLVRKPIDQSVIRMGHLGIDKNNPDLHAVTVMNAILGGNGFSSRLMAVVRSREGLAYNVASSFQAGRRFPGTFEAETETKAGSTVRAISLMGQLISEIMQQPVSDAELALAKESIINSFMFAFTNSASVVAQRARLDYYNFPKGYLETYRDKIAQVSKEDVLRVARQYLRPQAMTLVVVGDDSKFDKPLSTIGTVRELLLDAAE